VPLADVGQDLLGTLEALADALGARDKTPKGRTALSRPALPEGPMTLEGLGQVVAALIPENAIVVDESVTGGRALGALTATAAPHDFLTSTGGAIGFGMPTAIGAAIAAPDRKVLVLEGDGSAMYTVQSLWTMAREGLDVTVLIFANRAYRILQGEYAGVGAGTLSVVFDTDLTCGPVCNDIDINNDGSLFDPIDIDAFLSVFSEGPCVPAEATCDGIDFNGDGGLFDPCDIDAFLLVFSEGPCTLCGV
jgi:thiamine pyrophosphate-dependent acetolactate synthase large subunit-like protein